MYQALYRKYRPRMFSDVTGQEHVTETLKRQISLGRLSHAYLFVGTRGTGKTTCAKILSRAVNCQNPVGGDPCNACASCKGIESGAILDVLELDAASNNGVDNVRALREEAIYSPASVKKRVYIIDEVHMLSSAAFNALLKILEEPPEHLIFILATTELHKVPATILSRCQRFSFKRISQQAISARLFAVAKKEGLTLTPDAAAKLAALADGSMRDALSLLDQCASDTNIDLPRVLEMIGLAGHNEILRLAGAVAGRNATAGLEVLDKLYDNGRDMASLLNELALVMRDTLVHKLSPGAGLLSGSFDASELSDLSAKLPPERLFFCLDVIREALTGLQRGGIAKLPVEMCLIKMCDERASDAPAALLSRIERLEGEEERGQSAAGGGTLQRTSPAEAGLRERDSEDVSGSQIFKTLTQLPSTGDSQPSIGDSQPATDNTQLATVSSHWGEILRLIEDDVPTHALLSDGVKVRADIRDDAIVLSVGDAFTASLIDKPSVKDLLKESARKALGRDVMIRIDTGGGSGEVGKQSKLDALRAFDIVKFE